MTKQHVMKFAKDVGAVISKRSPEILTGLAIAGGVSTVILAVKATPKAMQLLEEAEQSKRDVITDEGRIDIPEEECRLTKKEVIKTAWKPYIPAAITGAISIACVIGSRSVSARRNAALATAYQLSEAALSEYKDKVVETIGEVKEREIQEEIAKDRVEKHPVQVENIFETGKGDTLFLEYYSGRWFKSSINAVEAAKNTINARLNSYDYVSLNEFYEELGLAGTGLGNDLGWNRYYDGLIDVNTVNHNGAPYYVVSCSVQPRYDYSSCS